MVDDAPRRLQFIVLQFFGERPQRLRGQVIIELQPGSELAFPQHPQIKKRIGDGRFAAAPTVAGWARRGTRTARANLQQAAMIHKRDGAAAGTDRPYIHPWGLNRHAIDLALVQQPRRAVDDQARIETGAAHIGGNQVAESRDSGQLRAPLGTPNGPRHDGFERPLDRVGERHGSSAGTSDETGTAEADGGKVGLHMVQVTRHSAANERIHNRRAGSLVVPVFAGQAVRERNGPVVSRLPQNGFGLEFMLGIRVGMQIAHRDRGHAGLPEAIKAAPYIVRVQRPVHGAIRADPFSDRGKPQISPD